MNLTEEDFSAWRDLPMTQAVMSHLSRMSQAFRDEYVEVSFGAEQINERNLMMLLVAARSKAQICKEITELDLEDIIDDSTGSGPAARRA